MALQCNITAAGGVVATYHKATLLNADTLQGKLTVGVRSYLNKDERDGNVDNTLLGGSYDLPGPLAVDESGDWRPWAYAQLVALPDGPFAGATNV